MEQRIKPTHKKLHSCKPLKPTLKPKLAREYFFLLPEKEFNFYSPTLRYFNFFANAHPTTDNQPDSLLQTLTGQGDTTRKTEARTGNKVLPQWGLTWLIEQLRYYQLLCIYSTDGFQIPPLRQYPNRWRSL